MAAPLGRLSGWRFWTAMVLPFVFAARAILLVFQLHDEHGRARKPQQVAADAAPHPGETIRFETTPAVAHDLARRPEAKPFLVRSLAKDFVASPPGVGCLLDPAAMSQNPGGVLVLRTRDVQGGWIADWSGGPTVGDAEAMGPETAAGAGRGRRQEMLDAAMRSGEDCGANAEIRISRSVLRNLEDTLAGRPLTPPDPADRGGTYIIRMAPPPSGPS